MVQKFTKPGIPIILIHRGLYPSVFWALKRAQSSNPDSDIILLSETSSAELTGIHYMPISDYESESEVLLNNYVHMSNYSRNFEVICFQRWFILSSFMKTHALDRVFYMDSDVLLYSDISRIKDSYSDCDITLASGGAGECAHASYINSIWIVDQLIKKINLIFEVFRSENLLKAGKEMVSNELINYLKLDRYYFPLNDMKALSLLRSDTQYLVQNSSAIINGAMFDYAISDAQSGFEMDQGAVKKLTWENGVPYCLHKRLNKKIRFHAVHYQGGVRGHMKRDFCLAENIAIDSIPDCGVQSLATRH